MARLPLVLDADNRQAESVAADGLILPGAIELSGVVAVTLSANETDYALPDNASALLIDADTAVVEIRGMQGGAQGRVVRISVRQSSAFGVVLVARAGPTADNWFGTDVDTVIAPGESVTMAWMDPGGSGNPAWRVDAHAPVDLTGYATETYADAAAAAARLHYRRDDLTATGGEEVLSTTADIYEGTLQLFLDGVLIPIADYAMTGVRVATLDTPATAAEVYSVAYWSADTIPGASVWLATLTLTGDFADGQAEDPYESDIAIAGGDGVYSNPHVTAGALPVGMALSIVLVGSDYKLRLSGTSTVDDTYAFTAAVESGDGQTATSAQSIDLAPAPRHPYWRLRVTANNVPGGLYTETIKIEMRETPGGADQCTGGSSFASTDYVNANGAHAFDGSDLTYWSSNGALPQTIGYHFATSVLCDEVTVKAPRSSILSRGFNAFTVQSSDDGSAWNDEWSVTGQTGWTELETRTFTRP